jgi:hypothetical protein
MRSPLALAALLFGATGCNTGLDLGWNDAGIPYEGECKPGTYSGSYACTTTSASPVQLSGTGPFSITLVPSGARTLSLTPDASLATTSSGITAVAFLSGVLDCSTRQLTGIVSEVTYSSPMFNATVTGTGRLGAVYEEDGGPPTLLEGILDPPSTLETTCTWTATLE